MNDSTEKPDPLPHTEKIYFPGDPGLTVLDRSPPVAAPRLPVGPPSAITRSSTSSAAAAWASSSGPGSRSLNRLVALKMLLPGSLPTAADLRSSRPRPRRRPACATPTSSPIHEVGEHDGCPLLQHGLDRGRQPGAAPGGPPCRGRAAAALREASPAPSPRPPARHHPPRPQAGQHPARPARRAARHRLRPGQALDADSRETRRPEPSSARRLHGARAGRRRSRTSTAAADVYGLGAILYEC